MENLQEDVKFHNFHSFTVHRDITSIYMQLIAQLDCFRKMLKLTLNFTSKCSYMFQFNKPSSGKLLFCFAKVIIINGLGNYAAT